MLTGLNMKRVGPLAAVGLIACTGLVGCRTPTSPPGRRPVDETTDAERRDVQQQPESLREFREQVITGVLQDLPGMPEVSEINGPVTVLLGDVNNQTGVTSTLDYEYVVTGIRTGLVRSGAARDKLYFVERRARIERIADRERVATGTEVAFGDSLYNVPDYDASRTFVLNMDVFRIGRGNTSLYAMDVSIVSFATNRVVDAFHYEMKQVND